MGLSNYVPNSRIAQPGVCTSTTRPATPYEGQVIFETDTNRVLVWDASAWVMIADTDQPPGMQLIKAQTIGSAVATVTVSDVFSSEYDNYKITVTGGSVSSSSNVKFQLSGSTGSTYSTAGYFMTYGSATVSGYGPAATTTWLVGYFSTSTSSMSLDVFNPNLAKKSGMSAISTETYNYSFTGQDTSTAQSTGFTLSLDTGGATMTGGTIRVYGYRNS